MQGVFFFFLKRRNPGYSFKHAQQDDSALFCGEKYPDAASLRLIK